MKKKTILKSAILLAGVGVAVILAGCGGQSNKLDKAKDNINAKIESSKEMIQEGKNLADNNKGLAGGLKDAIKKGITMKCVSDTADGHWVTYIKGKNTRTDGTTADGHEMAILVKGKVIYTWDKKTKKGQKVDQGCMDEFNKSMGNAISDAEEARPYEEFNPENMEIEEKGGKLKCAPSTNADFSVPSDVHFDDQCAMLQKTMSGLKNQMNQMKNIKK